MDCWMDLLGSGIIYSGFCVTQKVHSIPCYQVATMRYILGVKLKKILRKHSSCLYTDPIFKWHNQRHRLLHSVSRALWWATLCVTATWSSSAVIVARCSFAPLHWFSHCYCAGDRFSICHCGLCQSRGCISEVEVRHRGMEASAASIPLTVCWQFCEKSTKSCAPFTHYWCYDQCDKKCR